MKNIDFNSKESPKAEITIQIRDKDGNPTGKTKTCFASTWRDVYDWHQKQSPKKKKKRRRNTRDK